MPIENPFTVYSPEQLTPKAFREIFVKEHTWINALETPKDFFVEGSRGSGKSMLLNYLEFSHQLCYFMNNLDSFFEQKDRKYFGIMVHVTQEELNTSTYELLIRNNLAKRNFIESVCMHDLTMAILYRLLKTFTDDKIMRGYINNLDKTKTVAFCDQQLKSLDKRRKHSFDFSKKCTNSNLLTKLAEIFLKERKSIKYYAYDTFQVREAIYDGNYSNFTFMNSFINNFKILIGREDFSFYILMDNGDDAKITMQKCINKYISQRKHDNYCIKIAIKKGTIWNKDKIQWLHDYSRIDIDEMYSAARDVYNKRIKQIANIRLKIVDITADIEDFLIESPTERELFEKIKSELTERYEKEYYSKYNKKLDDEEQISKSDYVNNRVNKYTQAELFRRLKKTPKSYAGFQNIVHLSSGIIRQFLDICSNMFTVEEMKQKKNEIVKIGLKTQNDVIKKYADDFMDELEEKYKSLEKQEFTHEEAKRYKDLYVLIESLGCYYKELLMDKTLKEPRVFTFTLRDPGTNPHVDQIVELGVNENYFQFYWYSSKSGVGKYRGYAFNRRLCPRYGIDHTSFRGRRELTTADLVATIKTGKIPKSRGYKITLDKFVGE